MATKLCTRCKLGQPTSEFYSRRKSKDGLHSNCKSCCKETARLSRERNPERAAGLARAWAERNPERAAEAKRRYKRRHREKLRADSRRRRETEPEKIKARQILNNAVNYGKIERPDTCGRCEEQGDIQAHHHDYSKPLDVEWLCRGCHVEEHH